MSASILTTTGCSSPFELTCNTIPIYYPTTYGGVTWNSQKQREEKMKLYEYAVYYVPNEQQKEKGEEAKIILVDHILGMNEDSVRTKVIRKVPTIYEDKLDQVVIEIRRFR